MGAVSNSRMSNTDLEYHVPYLDNNPIEIEAVGTAKETGILRPRSHNLGQAVQPLKATSVSHL